MQLISLLDRQLLSVEEKKVTKEEVLSRMLGKICSHFTMSVCAADMYQMVIKREMETSTTYPTGIAMPHVRMDNLNDTVIAMCTLHQPIMENDIPIRMIVLIVTDKNSSKLYLNVVSAFLKLSKDEQFMQHLLSQKDASGIYHTIEKAHIMVKEELTISDVMVPEPFTVSQDATLKELGDIFSDNNISFIPVVDHHNRLVGEVNILQYLKVGVPDYMMMLDNLKFLRTFEPFEHLYEKEETVRVRDIMAPVTDTLDPDTSIIESVFRMIHANKTFFVVTQDKQVIGTIRAMEIFRKAVRA